MNTTMKILATISIALALCMPTQNSHAKSTSFDLRFKPLEETDFELVHTWVQRPFVKCWFEHLVMPWDEFQEAFRYRLQCPTLSLFIVETKKQPIGFIGYYDASEFPDGGGYEEPEGTYGIDLFIGEEEYLGKGYGTAMLSQFITKMLNERRAFHKPITKIIVDPHTANTAAIGLYKKLGFTIIRQIDSPLYGDQYIMAFEPQIMAEELPTPDPLLQSLEILTEQLRILEELLTH